jgi:hypothetical protein
LSAGQWVQEYLTCLICQLLQHQTQKDKNKGKPLSGEDAGMLKDNGVFSTGQDAVAC